MNNRFYCKWFVYFWEGKMVKIASEWNDADRGLGER